MLTCFSGLYRIYCQIEIYPFEMSALKVMDYFFINWLLPISAFVISQVAIYKLDEKKLHAEFVREGSPASETIYGHWKILVRWVIPCILFVSLFLQFLDLLV
ncbi:MAG: hypothetical protein R2827_11225 [Bdellovibrionales bacterium]